ncbi:MAG: hypothetical protein CVT49_12270 [candidate division Zixibacteria bacterium HGW-Zixibacteria-1]|nr:MAG: hypothetical protein CVT49_12270 [candidate division Zixibacteria bacterium HGW-Zixibacteria-1]
MHRQRASYISGRKSWESKPRLIDKISITEPAADPFTHIGVALDNSDIDEFVISRAMSLAKIHKAEITLIHVSDAPGAQVYGENISDEHTRDDIDFISEVAEILKHQGYNARSVLKTGQAAQEIIKAVRDEKIDLFIMGSHGHRLIGDMFYGETVSTVRHNLDVPIMVVKAQA